MNEISSNIPSQSTNLNKDTEVETPGVIAQNNKPSGLFSATPETAGVIASNTSSTSGGNSFCANA